MQHDGELSTDRRCVVLKMYLVSEDKERHFEEPLEHFHCTKCGKKHEVLYKMSRRPVDMLGCWVRFRYNGALHAPDLSIPLRVTKLPRGAVRVTDEAASVYWHSS